MMNTFIIGLFRNKVPDLHDYHWVFAIRFVGKFKLFTSVFVQPNVRYTRNLRKAERFLKIMILYY